MARDRKLIEANEGDKRYVRRNEEGEFTEDQSDVGRSLAGRLLDGPRLVGHGGAESGGLRDGVVGPIGEIGGGVVVGLGGQ